MTTDAYTVADRALEVCGAMVTDPKRIGAPVLVRDGREPVLYPPVELREGVPVVALIVLSDGVFVVSERYRVHGFTAAAFFAYPKCTDMKGWPGALWREQVDVYLTAALSLLPAAGSALAGP